MKDALKKCLVKQKVLTKTGAAASTLPTRKYFEIMNFLHERISNKPTESNVELATSTPRLAILVFPWKQEFPPLPVIFKMRTLCQERQ